MNILRNYAVVFGLPVDPYVEQYDDDDEKKVIVIFSVAEETIHYIIVEDINKAYDNASKGHYIVSKVNLEN